MTLYAHRRWYFLLVAGALSALSCDSQTEVRSTIPSSNARDVDPRSVIAVRLSNSVADTDSAATDVKNISVTGDLSEGPYSGAIKLAHHLHVFHGQTVEEFESDTPNENADPDAEPLKKDTIVFLLASGTSFKDGETVTVVVDHDVTAKGTPLRKHKTFSFRVRGGSGATGELRVSSTTPGTGGAGVNARPRVTAAFSRAVRPDALASSIALRGSHSGVHKGGDTVFSKSDDSTHIREVVRRLAVDDAFLPGETVSVTYSSGILEAGTAASPAKLSPYHLEFQVESGVVKSDWSPLVLPNAGDRPVALAAANFRPAIDGTELAIVTREDLVLYSQTAHRVWSRVEMPLPLGSGSDALEPVDAIAYDTKDDGAPEILLLLTGANGSRLLTIEVAESGALSVQGKTLEFPAVGVGRMTLADLDANGKPEILVSHPSRKVAQGSGDQAKDTGALSILELRLVPPDPEDIDPSSPDSLLPTLAFQLIENPVQGFKPATRMEPADLNVDGKLDLVCETEDGLVIFRNIGNASTQFALRSVAKLRGRTESILTPLAWVLLDIDSDGDRDILAWDAEGALLHRNRQGDAEESEESSEVIGTGLFESTSVPEPLSGLPVLAHPALARALDLDGDATMDIALAMRVGGVTLLIAKPSVGGQPEFRSIDQPSASESPGIVAADLDGDSGLDIATTGLPSGNVHLLLAEGVDEPSVFVPSAMRFAAESTGLTDLEGETVRVAILGDFTETFTGYSIALDHDETKLKYKGFEIPGDFERNASFTLCPDVNLQGCAGNVSVRMSYLQGTRGAPAAGILLGTLLFERNPVTSPSTTKLELKSFDGPNQTKFDNSLIVTEGNGSASVPLLIEESILEVPLLPPAPSSLDAECGVLSRGDASLDGRVTWSSPAGTIFKEFRIEVGGQAAVVLSGTTSSHDFTTSLTGVLNVRVTGVDQAERSVSAECQVIGIHRPTVTCVAISDSENRVTWAFSHTVDRFAIYRNGIRLGQTTNGVVNEFVDSSPSQDGADNYEVVGVISSTEGPRGSCQGGPIGDPDPGTTLPPRITEAGLLSRPHPSASNVLRFRWANGEGYDGIVVTLGRAGEETPFLTQNLSGSVAEFIYEGDAPGGVKPQQYIFSVAGRVGGRSSTTVKSSTLSVPVPVLGTPFNCTVDGFGNVPVFWNRVWAGYSGLKLVVEHRIDGNLQGTPQETTLALDAISFTVRDIAPVGVYRFILAASYTDPLPAPLVPLPQSLERICEISFAPRVRVGRVEAGVGLSGVELPVVAEVIGTVNGFHFELEYPSFFIIDPQSGLRVDHQGAVITEFSIVNGTAAGTKRAIVTVSGIEIVPDADGDGEADGQAVLATLVGAVPLDFGLAGEKPLRFAGLTSLRFSDLGNTPVAVDDKGALVVRRRFVVADKVTVAAGSSEVIKLGVRATFDAPASAPNYRLNAFTIHLHWDPELLDLVSVLEEDQEDTAVAGKGSYFLPNDASLISARASGDLKVSWIGFNFSNPSQPTFLTPGVDLKLLFLRFRSKVPGDQSTTFAALDFVSSPTADNPTAFFPEVDVPSEPDLEGFFGGGVRVVSNVPPFAVHSLSPGQGSLLGGNEAVIRGTGFLSGGATAEDLSIELTVFPSVGNPVVLPVTNVLAVGPSEVRFRVPDSGLRTPARFSTPVDVKVTSNSRSRTLANAYSYEFPRLTGADLTGGRASGGQLMVLRGAGLAPASTVLFRVPGVAAPFSAVVSSVSDDGTELRLLTPDLRGQETKRATIEVTVPGVAMVPLPGTYEVRADGSEPLLKITSVSPGTGLICGGEEVTISGEGFLPSLSVRFGSVPAPDVDVVDGKTARVTTPSMVEGTGTVSVSISNDAGPGVRRESGFTFSHPAPAFKRGDVNDDANVTISDVVVLSDLVLGKASTLPDNVDAADVNDDGVVNGGDLTVLMALLFGGLGQLPPPFAAAGFDPTPDSLTSCASP